MNVLELDATEALTLIRSGDLSAERYAASLLAHCRKYRALNAFIWQGEEHVMQAARAADQRRAASATQILDGLPIVLKDNIDTVEAPTSAGTPALRQHRPRTNARVADALFGAGALLLGKTNMHELAFGITSANPAYGNVHNPYDASMIAGGSSGGSAAAIAARMCPVGLGTDTGGSVRIPAALCGIAGLRPTVGRYSQDGIVPLSHTRDTAGPMARSIQDLALLDSVLSGTSQALSAAVVAGLRLGVPRGYFYEDLDPDLAPVIESALRKLRDAGCVLIEADIPRIEQLCAISGGIVFHEFAADLQRYLSASGADTTVQEVARQIASPDVKALYEENVVGASAPTSAWYQTAMASGRPALQAAYRDYFRVRDVEAIVLPTTRLAARPLGQDVAVELNGKVVSTFLAYLHNTHPITTAGMPGLSIPVGLTSSGLPVGLEFDALQGQDRRLLGIGLGVEGLFDRLPSPVP